MIGWANAGQHQQARRTDGAGGDENLTISAEDPWHAIDHGLQTGCPAVADDDAGGLGIYHDSKIRACQSGIEKGRGGR